MSGPGALDLAAAAVAPARREGEPAPAGVGAGVGAGLEAGGASWDEAFSAFYRRTARAVWAYLARASGDPALADDLTQEAYLRLLRSGFEGGDEEHRRRYLFRIASNLLRDHHRYRRVRREQTPPAEGAPAAAAGDDPGLRRDLGRLLLTLRPRHRRVLWLAHVEGASHREIAAATGIGEASVRLVLFRARRKLAGALRREGYRPPEPEPERDEEER